MAERVVHMGVAVLVGIYVARYLGPERFGILSYATSFVGLFSAISMLGLDSIVVRELVKDETRRDELLGTAFWLKLGGALLVLLQLTVVLQVIGNTAQENLLIFIIAAGLLFQSVKVIDLYFQSKVNSRYVVQAQLTQVAISSAAKLTLVAIQAPLLWFALVAMADSAVLSLGLIVNYLRQHQSLKRWQFRLETAKALLRDSWPLILVGIATSFNLKVDQVMLKKMLDAEAVGNYAAAVSLSEAWYFVPMAITTSVFPAIIKAKQVSEELYYQRLQRLCDLMIWLSVAIALPVTFLSGWIVTLLYGPKFTSAGMVLTIHIWAGVFVFLQNASKRWFVTENIQKIMNYNLVLGVIINIILNYILIPKFGIVSAAYSTLISYGIAFHFGNLFYKQTRKLYFMQIRAMLFISLFNNNRFGRK